MGKNLMTRSLLSWPGPAANATACWLALTATNWWLFPPELMAIPRLDVIYGKDSRKDLYEFTKDPDGPGSLATSTALLTTTSRLDFNRKERTVTISGKPLWEKMKMCRDEPFANQPVGGWCSGFLAAPDILVTAGHCIANGFQCSLTSVVFGFSLERPNADPGKVSIDNVFKCKDIIKRTYHPPRGLDFAIIRLDRPVQSRKPLKIRRNGSVATDEKLTVIGHPSGLPTKISQGSRIRENSASDYFVTNTDSFRGNSGSAVLNKHGIVEGILVRGENDYDASGGCYRAKKCAVNECRGEDVLRTKTFSYLIP